MKAWFCHVSSLNMAPVTGPKNSSWIPVRENVRFDRHCDQSHLVWNSPWHCDGGNWFSPVFSKILWERAIPHGPRNVGISREIRERLYSYWPLNYAYFVLMVVLPLQRFILMPGFPYEYTLCNLGFHLNKGKKNKANICKKIISGRRQKRKKIKLRFLLNLI